MIEPWETPVMGHDMNDKPAMGTAKEDNQEQQHYENLEI